MNHVSRSLAQPGLPGRRPVLRNDSVIRRFPDSGLSGKEYTGIPPAAFRPICQYLPAVCAQQRSSDPGSLFFDRLSPIAPEQGSYP